MSLHQADHSSRGVLPTLVCLSAISKTRQGGGLGSLGAAQPWKTKVYNYQHSERMHVIIKVMLGYSFVCEQTNCLRVMF